MPGGSRSSRRRWPGRCRGCGRRRRWDQGGTALPHGVRDRFGHVGAAVGPLVDVDGVVHAEEVRKGQGPVHVAFAARRYVDVYYGGPLIVRPTFGLQHSLVRASDLEQQRGLAGTSVDDHVHAFAGGAEPVGAQGAPCVLQPLGDVGSADGDHLPVVDHPRVGVGDLRALRCAVLQIRRLEFAVHEIHEPLPHREQFGIQRRPPRSDSCGSG